ncbi:Protein crumbs like protein [Argiope bruennichi]|uniref:Protein crumbs like protein n=1 Tax=Argiope bruennichi TaxID=94029 RepID=A0A8T0FV85_ARGBR|nr:Protein crumbs like protein [Argiope bruennichi]
MGKNCEDVYNACGSSPCRNGGTCQTTIPSHEFSCSCPEGFLGSTCEVDINDCEGVICPTGKICVDLQNSYECRCPAGFSGEDCSINIDECSSNPCVNGTCVDGIGAFACHCPKGLTGKLCESDIDECQDSPCQHGICQNMFGTYLCYCTPGYTGTHCDIEFNECLSSPCQNGATCNDLVNNYSCTCVPGFAGRNCEIDINECDSNPCLNGATCSDQINRYECTCIPGFSGKNCEVNIDECASQPCQNGGKCVDMINEFVCNCTDTGFSGTFCETNINDCDPNPCQNGASCEDMIKDYHCQCYDGYNGKNCENDIDECATSPCLNSALCLENSNKTLYEMNYLGFFPSFSYEMASGFRCICASGFTGENCETNIDDCELNDCRHGICIDAINDYYCACHLGYEGMHCEREINECDTFEPCKNGATCIDQIADYKCECLPDFGGKNCQTKLIGCFNVQCLNGATCIPLLNDREEHIHKCLCPEGFHGMSCEIATTVSFDTGDSLAVTRYNDLLDTFNLEFQFRTTLPSGIISTGYVSNNMLQYILYLLNGVIKVDLYTGTNHIAQLFSKSGQNDALWKTVKLGFEPNEVSLNVSGWALQKRLNFSSLNFTVQFGSISNMAVNFDQNLKIPDFIGCIQDIYMNGDIIIPNDNCILHGAKEGCYREEQCEGNPCHNGFCKDNWLSYECVCSRPFFGTTCQYMALSLDRNNPYQNLTLPAVVEMVSHTLEVKWDLAPSRENEAFHKTVSKRLKTQRGDWHQVQTLFKCLCFDGYEGEFCDSVIDYCINNPCQNGGTCDMIIEPESAVYHCYCPSGFTGDNCQQNVNECENDPCDHGLCVDLIGHYRCDCYPGYKGDFCSDQIRNCTDVENVCYNGTCKDAPGGYKCDCEENFLGTHCSILNECHPSKCNNQGDCEPMYDENELSFIHTCKCNEGFTGHDCTKELVRGGDDNLILIILIPVMSLFILCLLIGSIIFLRIAKKKRATRGTYSPSRQEMFGSRVEMNHVMKPPPEERLI